MKQITEKREEIKKMDEEKQAKSWGPSKPGKEPKIDLEREKNPICPYCGKETIPFKVVQYEEDDSKWCTAGWTCNCFPIKFIEQINSVQVPDPNRPNISPAKENIPESDENPKLKPEYPEGNHYYIVGDIQCPHCGAHDYVQIFGELQDDHSSEDEKLVIVIFGHCPNCEYAWPLEYETNN